MYPDVSMFPPKIVTDDLIQRQYLGGGGLVQTSHTSGKKALQWVNMEDSEKADTLAKLQDKNYSEKIPLQNGEVSILRTWSPHVETI